MVSMGATIRSGTPEPPNSPSIPSSQESNESEEILFYPLTALYQDPFPLQQPDSWSLASSNTPTSLDPGSVLGHVDEHSVATTLSHVSDESLFSINNEPPLTI
jgi:hypothetical protein